MARVVRAILAGAATVLLVAACGPNFRPLTTARVSKLPPTWPRAQTITCDCGAYQAQAILRAEGKSIPIPRLYVSDWDRSQCSTLPWHFPSIFSNFGTAKAKFRYDFSDAQFLNLASHSLKRGHPLILLIQATKGHYGLHWISVWGYDAKQQVFLVYDSQYPTKVGGVGNTRYSPSFLESRFPWWTRIAIEVQD